MSEATQTEKKQAQKERKAYRAKKRKLFFKTLFSRKIVLVSAIVVLLIILIAIFADFLMPYNPNQISIPERNQGMSAAHWLGTDEYGRDLLSRVIAGSRVSLIVGLLAVIIACVIGTTLGMIAGYFGGVVDDIINRTSEAVRVIPQIVFAIALCAVFGGGILNLAIVLGISNTTVYIRMMRSQVLSIKEQEYVLAAKATGASAAHIIRKHMLPNCVSVIIITAAMQIPSAIFTESFLSFVGMGVSMPMPSLGSLASDARGGLVSYPYMLLFPALSIFLIVLSFNLLGNGLRDAFDPKLRS